MSGPFADPSTLTLHAMRLVGFAETHRIAQRYGLDCDQTLERLLDFEAHGWVTRSEFAGTAGWSLTERGRAENERRLAAELDAVGARAAVSAVHQRFLPLNARFQDAATRWQVRALPWDPMAANDHTDFRWDDRVIATLGSIGRKLAPLESDLAAAVPRFGGYAARYEAALARVTRGEARWVARLPISSNSCRILFKSPDP